MHVLMHLHLSGPSPQQVRNVCPYATGMSRSHQIERTSHTPGCPREELTEGRGQCAQWLGTGYHADWGTPQKGIGSKEPSVLQMGPCEDESSPAAPLLGQLRI